MLLQELIIKDGEINDVATSEVNIPKDHRGPNG